MTADKGFSDKLKGTVSKAKGELEDQVGNAKDDPQMQRKGKFDKAKGEVQDTVGDLKKGFQNK